MMLRLWPHQQAAIDAAWAAVNSRRRAGLIALPTGTGKTIMFATFARQMGAATSVLVHRDELVQQAVEAFGVVWPEAPVGVVKAGRNEWQTTGKGERPQVVVASVQSLHARRLATIPRNRFGLVIVDEAHHAAADSWAAVLDHFKPRFILGVTATPERADGKGLAERFGDRPLYSYPLRQAIDDGQLVRLIQYAVETTADLDGVSSRAGDLAVGELADAVNTAARNRVVVEAYQKHAAGRRALAFTVDVQHAHDLCEAFTAAGVRAAVVSGETEPGAVVTLAGREIGAVTSVARHHELGPIALAVIKRSADVTAELLVACDGGDVAASQEVVVPGEGVSVDRPEGHGPLTRGLRGEGLLGTP